MSAENGNQSFVLCTAFLKTLEFVATRAKSARRRCFQCSNRAFAFTAGVDKVFGQGANNAVTAGVHLADTVAVLPGGFDYPAGAGINDRGYPAGLGIEGVLGFAHSVMFSLGRSG